MTEGMAVHDGRNTSNTPVMTGPVSISTAAFDGHPLEIAIRACAAAGAGWVEPAYIAGYVDFDETAFGDANAARVSAVMRAEGVGAVAVSAHVDAGLPGAAAMLRRRAGFARALGAGILVSNAGAADRRDAVRRTLDALLPTLEDLGVVLALENPGHGSGALLACAADGAALAAAVGSPLVRLNYDAGNVFTLSGGLVQPDADIGPALPWLAHLHVKDVAARGGDWAFTAIGQGDVNCRALARLLAARAPGIPVGLELPLRLSRPGRGDPVRAAGPLPLETIRAAIADSLRFWHGAMEDAA